MTQKQLTLAPPDKLWRIPIDQRVIQTAFGFGTKYKWHVTDNIGFLLIYDGSVPITDDFIRHHLTMGETLDEYVIAPSKEAAIAMVSKRLEGLTIGGEHPLAKAQRIVDIDIDEIPLCPRLKLATKGDYKDEWMCHMLNRDGTKVDDCLGGCMFSDYDPPECCPLQWSSTDKKWHMISEKATVD